MKNVVVFILFITTVLAADVDFGDYDTSAITPQNDVSGYAFSQRYEEPFTCPGGGDSATLKGLSSYVSSAGGTAGNINVAIYKNSDTTRIAYGTTKKSVTSTNRTWLGFSQSEITPNPVKLKQGESYRIVLAVEGADVTVCYLTAGGRNTLTWDAETWYDGFPSTLTLGTQGSYARLMKATVDTAAAGGCDSMLSVPDTVGTKSDGISVMDSLICDSGKVVLRYAIYGGSSGRDSVMGKDAPYRYVDTIPMEPSDSVTYSFVFDSDTSTGVDTTISKGAWSRDSTDTSGYYYFTAPTETPTYSIDTTGHKVGSGTWTITEGVSNIDSGTTVHYSASAGSGYLFWKYGGTYSGTSATASYVISGNHVDSVYFRAWPRCTLHVTLTAGGTVTFSPDSMVDSGQTITATAHKNTGYVFNGWTGDTTYSDSVLAYPMKTSHSVTANFITAPKCTLHVSATNGTVVFLADSICDYGQTITATPIPAAGYFFSSWTGDITSYDNPLVQTMTTNLSATANFSYRATIYIRLRYP